MKIVEGRATEAELAERGKLEAEREALKEAPERLAAAPLSLSAQRHWELDTEILVAAPLLGKKLPFVVAPGERVTLTLAKKG